MKKKPFGLYSTLPFWIYHTLLFCAVLIVCIVSPRRISTDFTDIIPHAGMSAELVEADRKFTSSQSGSVTMFVEADGFERAKESAEKLYGALDGSGLFESISLNAVPVDTDELRNYITENVYLFLDEETCSAIEKNPAGFREDSLAEVFSGFTFSSMGVLEKDPFLLSENVWFSLLDKVSGLTSLQPKDGVLTAQADGKCYVMLSGTLTEKAMSLSSSENGTGDVFKIGDSVEDSDVKIYYSGVPFHTFESATDSQREITLIAVVSVCAILILFFAVFRNFRILEPFLISLAISVAGALSMLFICFRELHIMTLIFGTSLIGTCIDYSIHFYVRYANRAEGESGYGVRKRLFKSLSVGFVSTFLCYFILLFSSYPVLRQIAVFCAFGLFSSYICVLFLYPELITEKTVNSKAMIFRKADNVGKISFLPYIAAAATLLFIAVLPKLNIKNNISDLYTPSERLMEGESRFASLMGYEDSSYALVYGETPEKVLENESEFVKKISPYADVLAVSRYFPSVSQQKRSIEASVKLLPYLDEQAEILGLERTYAAAVKNKIENLQPVAEIPRFLSALDLGKTGKNYYHAVVIRDPDNEEAIKEIAGKSNGAEYFRISEDVSSSLDVLTGKILRLFALGFVLIALMLVVCFGVGKGLKMAAAPYSVITGTVALCVLFGMKVDFFMVIGLVLIIGLGLDYIVFACDEKLSASMPAVSLSFITTELSFGTLAFSSFKPVHIFGLTVFIGILIAYVCARWK